MNQNEDGRQIPVMLGDKEAQIDNLEKKVGSFYCNTFLITIAIILAILDVIHSIMLYNVDIFDVAALVLTSSINGLLLIGFIFSWQAQKIINKHQQIIALWLWTIRIVVIIGLGIYVGIHLMHLKEEEILCFDCKDKNYNQLPYSTLTYNELTVGNFLKIYILYIYLPVHLIMGILILANARIISVWINQRNKIMTQLNQQNRINIYRRPNPSMNRRIRTYLQNLKQRKRRGQNN